MIVSGTAVAGLGAVRRRQMELADLVTTPPAIPPPKP
jgi:hypothetical protein